MKTEHDIEEILHSAQNVPFSAADKEGIKAQLLARARRSYDVSTPARPVPSPWGNLWMRGSLSFAVFALVLVGTAQAAQGSIPGEPLYAVKVHVVEELVALSKFDPEDKATYQIALMETRFGELQELALQESVDEASLVLLSDQIEEHIDDATYAIAQATVADFSHERKLAALQKLATIARAQATLTKNDTEFDSIAANIEAHNDDATGSLEAEVAAFARESSSEGMTDYLSDEIAETGVLLLASSTDSKTQEAAAKHLNDVSESLVEGDTKEALSSLIKAQQAIALDEYFGGTMEGDGQEK